MMRPHKYFILFNLLLSIFTVFSQVPKKVIVEHFTNTLCSVCASRNPGFRTNLNAQDSILYISYHPSSPYKNCIYSQHNAAENDGRTKFYGLYGSTPRLAIQGQVISASANYNSSGLFTPYVGKTSPVAIRIQQFKSSSSGVLCRVSIHTVAAHSYQNARLYLALAEDTLDYNAPNGEKRHDHVFRKALTDSNGLSVVIPSKIGDSVVFNFKSNIHANWDINKIIQVAILQEESNKQVIQAEVSLANQTDPKLSVHQVHIKNNLLIYPNPCSEILYLDFPEGNTNMRIEISDMKGLVYSNWILTPQGLHISEIPDGVYMIRLISPDGIQQGRFIKLTR